MPEIVYRVVWQFQMVRSWARLRFARDRIRPGDHFMACSDEELVCTRADYWNDELMGRSVATGEPFNCSFWHCGPEKVT